MWGQFVVDRPVCFSILIMLLYRVIITVAVHKRKHFKHKPESISNLYYHHLKIIYTRADALLLQFFLIA